MHKTAVVMLAPLLLLAGPALAQNPAPGATTPSNQSQANKSSQANQKSPQMVRQQVHKNLQQAGFTDIQIMPRSLLARAKDKDGNPVMMVINPDSVTAVTEIPRSRQTDHRQRPVSHEAAGMAAARPLLSVTVTRRQSSCRTCSTVPSW